MATWRINPTCRLVGVGLIGLCSVARADDEQRIACARTLLKLLIDGKYQEFSASGDKTMKAAFGPGKVEQAWTSVMVQLGQYQSEESAELANVGGYDSIRFVCRFGRGRLTLRIVLDKAGRLSGLWFDEIKRDAGYTPPDYVDRSAFREEKVTVSAGRFALPGTLAIPCGPGRHAGVVLVHGSGPHDEDETVGANKPFRDLAWGLASRGVAVLRYEKRTHKYPTAMKSEEWTLEAETIDDALAAAHLLRKQSEIDAKRVFVAGHSLGGMAAPFIAARDAKLAGIIILAGNARSILDLLEQQAEYLAKLDGKLSEDERKKIGAIKTAGAAIRAGKPRDVPREVNLPVAYLARLHKLDAAEAASKLNIPILVIQGGRDYQVTKEDFAIWRRHLGERKNATFKFYEPLNHLFVRGKGPASPAEYEKPGHVDATVVRTIADWISSVQGVNGGPD